jgi:hypothetical protein
MTFEEGSTFSSRISTLGPYFSVILAGSFRTADVGGAGLAFAGCRGVDLRKKIPVRALASEQTMIARAMMTNVRLIMGILGGNAAILAEHFDSRWRC